MIPLPLPLPPAVLVGLAVVAIVGLTVIVRLEQRRLGPEADWLEGFRATVLPPLDSWLQSRIGGAGTAYTIRYREYVGYLDAPPEEAERVLWEHGLRRNYLAAYKTLPDDRTEIGSWAYRGDDLGPDEQVHVILFAREDGRTDVFAHIEGSSYIGDLYRRPIAALRRVYRHYSGAIYEPAPAWVTQNLPIQTPED